MLTFLTLFLGLTTGVQPVAIEVDGPVARVEVWLDGEVCGVREGPPWRFRCDFGEELAPHRLEARAFDAEGRPLGTERQLVNLAPRQGAVELTLERDDDDGPAALRVTWQSVSFEQPASVRVALDGEPLPVDDPERIPLPAGIGADPHRFHVASAEVAFPDGTTARTEITFGGAFGEAVATPNTAVPVLPADRALLRTAADAVGLLVDAHDADRPLRPVAVEGDAADLVAVVDGSALPELAGLREAFSGLHGRGGRVGLERGDRFFLVDPVPRGSARPGDFQTGGTASGTGSGYDVFATSPARDVGDGGLAWQLTHVHYPTGRPQRLADAVAMAAMQAAAGGRPRAVLLVLGPEARDDSLHAVARVRRFLDRLRVPLAVWWVERDPAELPAHLRGTVQAERSERRQTQVAFAAAWGGIQEVTTFRHLLHAARELRDAVGRQRIVWVEGVHLPTEVTLAEEGSGLRLLDADALRSQKIRTARDLATALPERLQEAIGTDGDGELLTTELAEDRPPTDPSASQVLPDAAPPLRPAGVGGPVLLDGGELAFGDTLRVDLVEVEVVVTRRNGEPVADLDRDDFELYEDGHRVDVTHFAALGTPSPPPTGVAEAAVSVPGLASFPLHLVVYLDEAHMAPEQRNRMLERLPALLDAVPPGTRVQLVVRDAGLELRLPFTGERDEVLAALRRAAGGSGGATLRHLELRQALAQIEAQPRLEDSLRSAALYASQRFLEVRQAVSDLEALVDSLAPLPGRKALLYLGSELPELAGREAFQAVERRWGTGAYGRTGHPALHATEYDCTRLYRSLASRANAARVTIYGLDAGGLRVPGSGGIEEKERSALAGLDSERAENAIRPLQLLSQATGGFAITGRNRIEAELARLGNDFTTGYLLGYPAAGRESGAAPGADPGGEGLRKLEVRVTRPGLRVRHRETYRPRSLEERMTEAVLAAFTVTPPDAPFAPDLGFGEAASLPDGSVRLPIRVHVPLSELVLVPRGDFYATRLDLFVAVEDEAGDRSPVRRAEVTVELPADRAAAARGFYTVTLPLRLEPGEQKVAVGVRDATTGAEGVSIRSVRVAPKAPLQRLALKGPAPNLPVAGAELLGWTRIPGGWKAGTPPANPFDRHPLRDAALEEERSASPW